MNKKKLLTIIASLALLVSVGLFSLAFFSDEKQVDNVITTGNIAIELHDLGEDLEDFPEDGIDDVVPGDEIVKIVKVENVGSNPAWIKVVLTPESNKENLDLSVIELELNMDEWAKGEDGAYYYYRALLPGETTENLLSSVTFPTDLGNDYANVTFTIGVQAYGVQSQNNGASALEASW